MSHTGDTSWREHTMNDAPERIWADEDTWFAGTGKTERAQEYVRTDIVAALIREAEVRGMEAKLVEALEALLHAVCGETGFASCVRANSGKVYPWPALDEAEALANAALAEVQARDEKNDQLR